MRPLDRQIVYTSNDKKGEAKKIRKLCKGNEKDPETPRSHHSTTSKISNGYP